MTRTLQRTVAILAGLAASSSGCGDSDGRASTTTTTHDEQAFTFRPIAYGGGAAVGAASLRATARRVEERAAGLKLRLTARVRGGTLVVTCAACGSGPPTETGRLFFYDWEKDVRDAECKAAPTDASVTGSQAAGQPGAGSQTYYEAVTRAARNCKATDERDDTTRGLWYGIDTINKKVVCGPGTTEADAARSCRDLGKKAEKLVEVPRGHVVVRAASDDHSKASQALARDAYFILEDDPGLRGADLEGPEQNTNSTTGQPTVTFAFTSEGRKKWRKVTREIARRGQAAVLPGVPPAAVANHFAIVLDDKIVSVPYIDPEQNPDGLSGADGSEISGSFTIASARRLATIIGTGALPLALKLVDERTVRVRTPAMRTP